MQGSSRLEAACDGDGWVESPRLRCLGFDFSVRSNDAGLVNHVTMLYGACRAAGHAGNRFILRTRTRTRHPSVNVYRQGHAVLRNATPGLAVAHMAWEVNRGVIENPGNRLLLHAAAAERDGDVVLLPGPQGAGKSTLVAALVRSGLRYVTDETVAIDPTTLLIEPYPKPIALDHGSPAMPTGRCPGVDPSFEVGLEHRLVPTEWLRRDSVAPAGGRASVLAFPRYRPESATAATPIERAEAAVALAEHAFNFRTLGPGTLAVVADVVRQCRCFRLDIGDLAEASRLIRDILEHPEVVNR